MLQETWVNEEKHLSVANPWSWTITALAFSASRGMGHKANIFLQETSQFGGKIQYAAVLYRMFFTAQHYNALE